MIAKLITILVFLFSFVVIAQAQEEIDWHYRWSEAGSAWYEKWTKTLDSLSDYSEGDQMEILAAASKIRNFDPTPEQVEITNRARKTLIAIPCLAKFFITRLEQSKKDMLEGNVSYNEYTKAQLALSVLS